MSEGPNPLPPQTPLDKRFGRLVGRARWSLLWEQAWPRVWLPVSIVLLFLTLPAAANEGRTVRLYYRSADGTAVLNGHGTVHGGIVSIPVTFTGTGRFSFWLATGNNVVNLAGNSAQRSTVVY